MLTMNISAWIYRFTLFISALLGLSLTNGQSAFSCAIGGFGGYTDYREGTATIQLKSKPSKIEYTFMYDNTYQRALPAYLSDEREIAAWKSRISELKPDEHLKRAELQSYLEKVPSYQLQNLSLAPKMSELSTEEKNRVEDIKEILKQIPSAKWDDDRGTRLLLQNLQEIVKPKDYWVIEYLQKRPNLCSYSDRANKLCLQVIAKIGIIPKGAEANALPMQMNDSNRGPKESFIEQKVNQIKDYFNWSR